MSSVQEITAAIRQLPEQEAWAVADWLDAHLEDAWDRQIAADAAPGGRLERRLAALRRDLAAGWTTGIPR
jgi:hypothetical protein